jgi:hypothetical protein
MSPTRRRPGPSGELNLLLTRHFRLLEASRLADAILAYRHGHEILCANDLQVIEYDGAFRIERRSDQEVLHSDFSAFARKDEALVERLRGIVVTYAIPYRSL